jgi:hypothetical protein
MPRKKAALRLIDCPRNSEVRLADGGPVVAIVNGTEVIRDSFTFEHIDGMFSLCSLDGYPAESFHLRYDTHVELVNHNGLENISTVS